MDNRKGDAQPSGFSHLFDAMGVKIRAVKAAGILDAAFSALHVVDDSDQFVVALVKKKPGNVIVHKMIMIRNYFLEFNLLKTKHYIQHPEFSRNLQTACLNYISKPS